jgi:hypothetical protein
LRLRRDAQGAPGPRDLRVKKTVRPYRAQTCSEYPMAGANVRRMNHTCSVGVRRISSNGH